MNVPVFLTGMMGSGKSTVGRRLAHALAADFVDLDERVERIFGQSVRELFAASETEFRRKESVALESLLGEPAFSSRAVVVATGGGIVTGDRNRELMLEAGVVVFLHTPVEDLVRRLRAQPGERPLLADAEGGLSKRLAQLLASRRRAYLDRSIVVDGRGSPDAVEARVLAAVVDSAGDRGSEAV